MKVYVPALETFTYPDVTVVCGPPALYQGASDVLTNPKLLFEVLSESTERYDRGEKPEGYRSVPSVSEHVLISQHKPHIEHFARQEDGSWIWREASAGGSVGAPLRVGHALTYARCTLECSTCQLERAS